MASTSFSENPSLVFTCRILSVVALWASGSWLAISAGVGLLAGISTSTGNSPFAQPNFVAAAWRSIIGWDAEHVFVMSRHELQPGLIGRVEWLALVPRALALARHKPKSAVAIQHDPMLTGSIHVQIHHILPYREHGSLLQVT